MIASTLFTITPLIFAAVPAAAVPQRLQRLWKDDAYCIDKTTETVTVTQIAAADPISAADPEGLQSTGSYAKTTETETETVISTSTLTVIPTAVVDVASHQTFGSYETTTETETETVISTSTLTVVPTAFDIASLQPSSLGLPPVSNFLVPSAATVTVFGTVTEIAVTTVTFHPPVPTSKPVSSIVDLDLPLITGSAVPLPLTALPYYVNSTGPHFVNTTQPAPYANSSLPTNTSAPLSPSSPSGYENTLYFTNWGIYAADYQPQSIPISKITRIIYAFATFGPDGTVISSDTYADLENHYPDDPWTGTGNNAYGCVKQLYFLKKKNRNLKVLLSIGGWSYSTLYPSVAVDKNARQNFASSAVQLITDWGFDGVEIDWEYPSDSDQGANLVGLLKELRDAMDAWADQNAPGYHFLITIASPAGPSTYSALPLQAMDQFVDSWNLMAYDYSGAWDTTTGHQANIYIEPNNTEATKFSTNQAVSDYIGSGIEPSKIVLGIPTFGRSFEATAGLGLPFTGVGSGSARLKQPGLWLYKDLPRPGAVEIYDETAKASYSYSNVTQELISYDNVRSAKEKSAYLLSKGLGGAAFWEASGDKTGTESLVSTLANEMGNLNTVMNLLNYPTSQYENIRSGMPGVY